MNPTRLPLEIVHYSEHDPQVSIGGVEIFARSLGMVFRPCAIG